MALFPIKHFRSAGGVLEFEIISPRIAATRMAGHLDQALAEHFLNGIDSWVGLDGKQLVAFHDWDLVSDYDSGARMIVTPWFKLHRPKFECVHMLVRSRTLAWGVRIVNSVTSDVMVAHHSRETFDQARCAVLGQARHVAL